MCGSLLLKFRVGGVQKMEETIQLVKKNNKKRSLQTVCHTGRVKDKTDHRGLQQQNVNTVRAMFERCPNWSKWPTSLACMKFRLHSV